MLKQAGAGGKYRIERQTCLLQCDGPKKSNIQVRTRSGSEALGYHVQRLHRIKCAECAPGIVGELELAIDPLRHDGLMVPVVHDGESGAWEKSLPVLSLSLFQVDAVSASLA